MHFNKTPGKILSGIKCITVEQWQRIDEDYKTNNNFDLKALSVFIAAAAVLIISKYFCKTDFIVQQHEIYKFLLKLPHPILWVKLYWAVSTSAVYFLIPAFVIKVIFKEKIRDFGFHFEKKAWILLLYFALFLIVIPFVYAVSDSPAFLKKYPFYKQAASSLFDLFFWEAGYGVQFVMLEFFFRGFLLFTLARYIGTYSIFVMVLPYTMIHFTKPLPETCGAVITGITLGTLALRTRSIYGGVIIHTAVAWSMDLFALYNKGLLQKLISKVF
ncbi:MAG: CPBP family intramembrane metalloprotease [Spirochaetes bacterium]|nr:CPBP family intramembrane metalloprotease [Spirochaetota bacterium]